MPGDRDPKPVELWWSRTGARPGRRGPVLAAFLRRPAGLDPDARPHRTARRWEPKKLRLRIFSCAGRLVRGGRRLRLRLTGQWPWAADITADLTRIPMPWRPADQPQQSLRQKDTGRHVELPPAGATAGQPG